MIRLLLLILVVIGTAHAADCQNGGSSPDAPLDVLVIGAGWSGLAAGNRLYRGMANTPNHPSTTATHSFCILEGRDAIGGRSRTHMHAFREGLPTELGSAWIYAGSNVYDIFQQAGLITDQSPSHFSWKNMGLFAESGLFHDNTESGGGSIQNDKDVRNAFEDFVQFARRNAAPTISMQTILDAYFQQLDPLSPDTTWIRRTVLSLVRGMIYSEWGAYLEQANSADMVNWLTPDYTIYFVAVPGGGYQPALQFFAAPFFNQHVRLNAQVTDIDYGSTINRQGDSVVKVSFLDTRSAGNATNLSSSYYYARAVICTVPLGVLQHGDIRFVPTLPATKLKAIQDMGMGSKNKCILYWDSASVDVTSWWPWGLTEMQLITNDNNNNNNNNNDATDWTIFSNDQNHNGMEDNFILTSWIGGVAADKWENRTDEETVAHVMGNLRKMFPPPFLTVPDPTKFLVTRWKSDPFSRGTYSYYRVGVNYRDGAMALAEPVGKNLYFAGEAAAPGGMGCPNAFNSGERAVEWLLNSGVLVPRDPTTTTTASPTPSTSSVLPQQIPTPPPTLALQQETTMPPVPLVPQQQETVAPTPLMGIIGPTPTTAAPAPPVAPAPTTTSSAFFCGRTGFPCELDTDCCAGFICLDFFTWNPSDAPAKKCSIPP